MSRPIRCGRRAAADHGNTAPIWRLIAGRCLSTRSQIDPKYSSAAGSNAPMSSRRIVSTSPGFLLINNRQAIMAHMTARERQRLGIRLMEIDIELQDIANLRVVGDDDGDPAQAEDDLLQQQNEIKCWLDVDYFERRDPK
jgi:hypothetical protein